MNASSSVSRLRKSSSRPESASLNVCTTSPICPSPPAFTTTDSDDSVSSVVGYVDESLSVIVAPGGSLPSGF